MIIKSTDRILFQGDSITDCKRNRDISETNDALAVMNRGVSGDRVVDLYARWRKDTVHLDPTVVSILIGVNDTWHAQTRDDGVEITQRRALVAKLSVDFGATLVPFQSLFDSLCRVAPAAYWAADGVHPTVAGHTAMADYWIDKVACK